MMVLKPEGKFMVAGRGEVYTINLKENNLPCHRSEIYAALKNKEVEINGESFLIWTIEMYATSESYLHDTVGILVKRLNQRTE